MFVLFLKFISGYRSAKFLELGQALTELYSNNLLQNTTSCTTAKLYRFFLLSK